MGHISLALLIALSIPLPSVTKSTSTHLIAQRATSHDSEFVRSSCRIYWNLPEPSEISANGIAMWSRQIEPAVTQALTLASRAAKANKKWSSFELDMITFAAAVELAKDPKYAFVFSRTPTVVRSMNNLAKLCSRRG